MKNLTINIKKVGVFFTGLTLFACNVLDETPDNRTELNTTEKVGELLTSAYPSGYYALFSEAMSDNAVEKVNVSDISKINSQSYHWEIITETGHDTPTFYWNGAYQAIAHANQALEAVEKMGSGANYLKGEALLARAYAHFMLGLFWCKSYNPATAANNLGLPYVKEVEKKPLVQYKRVSLAEYFKNIQDDLEEGLPLIDNSKYKQAKFHFTREAALAFATRFYTYTGDWQKVLTYANEALTTDQAVVASKIRDNVANEALQASEQRNLYASPEVTANLVIASVASIHNRYYFTSKYGMSASLSNQVDGTHPFGGSYSILSNGLYSGDQDNRLVLKYTEYFKYTDIQAGIGYPYVMAVLLSYDEILLNRMEANVMLGNDTDFFADLKTFLSKKSKSYTFPADPKTALDTKYAGQGTEFEPFYTLTAAQRAYLKCVVDMRRAEFMQEGFRWFDNKRFNMEITHTSPKGTFTLTKDDPRRELQIPADAISNGIEANPR